MKLKKKLLLLMILVGVLPALFVAGYASYRISGFIESRQSEQMIGDSRIVAEYLQDFLEQRNRDIRLLLANPVLKQSLITDFDYSDVDKLLAGLVEDKDNPFSFFMVTRQDGVCVSASDKRLIGKQNSEKKWHKQTLVQDTYYSDWNERPPTEILSQPPFGGDYRYTMVISKAIKDSDGTVLGTLNARVKWQLVQHWLKNRIQNFRDLGWQSKSLTLIRSDGTVIGHEQGSERYGQKIQDTLAGAPNHIQQLQTQDRGFFINRSRDQAVVYGFVSVNFNHFQWKVLTSASAKEFYGVKKEFQYAIVFVCMICLLVAVGLGVLTGNGIVRPLNKVVSMLQGIATGEADLTVRLPLADRNGKLDEIGELALAFNTFIANLESLIRSIQGSVETMGYASLNMDRISDKMAGGARQMFTSSSDVATSSGEMNANMNAMARAIGESNDNVGMVAVSVEEMARTIGEVAGKSEDARNMTQDAVNQAALATQRVEELGHAAHEISKVTETISDIAEQTNLLALNATIEAARAGDAGKGFAVVADEIKALARQTSESTMEIKHQVEEVQESTAQTVEVINHISTTNNNVSDIVATITGAVEEQAAASHEITANVVQVSEAMQEVIRNVTQTLTVNTQVSHDSASLKEMANSTANQCIEVSGLAGEQKNMGVVLTDVIGRFKVAKSLFDIGQVKNDHFDWKTKLEAALQGRTKIAPHHVTGPHECKFGQWYDAVDKKMTTLPEYKAVGEYHEDIHARAVNVVELHNQGETEKARAELLKFDAMRNKLFAALDELYLCQSMPSLGK